MTHRAYKMLVKRARPYRQDLSGRDFARELIRVRDRHTCQSCFRKWTKGQRRFDVHHLAGECGKNSTGYDCIKLVENNLITLCHKCHYNHHQFSKRLTGAWL